MRRISYQAVFVLACALSACSSAPKPLFDPAQQLFNPDTDPYWSDPKWDAALLDAVQSVVLNPVDPTDRSTPSLHGEVQFTLVDGKIENPEITKSTGDPAMDKLMLEQVASASPPKTTGPHAGETHDFALALDMSTPFEALEYAVYTAIDHYKVYPKGAILGGEQGLTTVSFDYLDGKASNITVTKSSRSESLDAASIWSISKAVLPLSPEAYIGKTLHMEALVCYSLNNAYPCPAGKHAIEVRGTIVRR